MMSYVDPEGVAPPPSAARVGSDLRAARQRLGWALPDVSGSLRIRLPYLQAIEEGRPSELPGNAYAVGFVRTYASALGLDPDEVARRFREEAREVNAKPKLTFPAPVPTRGVPAGAVVLIGLLIAGGAYVGWYRYTGSEEAAVTRPATPPPDRLAAMAPQVQSPQVASLLPATPAAPPLLAPPPPVPSIPVPVPIPVAIAPPAPALVTPVATSRFQLRSKAGGFVSVKERLGKSLLRRVLTAGEAWPVPPEPDLLLSTGNAAGLELLVDGKPALQPLGAAGAVLNDMPLDPVLARAAKPASTGSRPTR